VPPSSTDRTRTERRLGASIGHYVRRFFTSLSRRAPDPDDDAWAAAVTTPGEHALFARLGHPDRRHLIASARQVEAALGPDADPVWIRAALLHDVGKYHARLGVIGRSVSTVCAYAIGRRRVQGWAGRAGVRGRIGRYEQHGELGAEELRAAGSPEPVAEWSALHHHPERFAASPIPDDVLAVLDRADH
jgi:putative nucleotidyltransferase with HDIG domain